MRGAEHALERIERHVEQQQVNHHFRFAVDLVIGGKIVEREQGGQVFIIINVRKPFAEPSVETQIQPAQNSLAIEFHFLLPSFARIGENFIGIHLPGQICGGCKQDVVVFRPGAKRVDAGFVGEIFEVEDGLLCTGAEIRESGA